MRQLAATRTVSQHTRRRRRITLCPIFAYLPRRTQRNASALSHPTDRHHSNLNPVSPTMEALMRITDTLKSIRVRRLLLELDPPGLVVPK